MGITYGDHLIDIGHFDITPEQEREIEAEEAMAKHTPGQMVVALNYSCKTLVRAGDPVTGRRVAVTWCSDSPRSRKGETKESYQVRYVRQIKENEANAERIALTWNLHDELVSVAKRFCEMIDDDPERYNIAEPSCNECTSGCTPYDQDKGLCAYHTARSIIFRLEGAR